MCCPGKKLLMAVLKAFDHWFGEVSMIDVRSYLDYSIQLQAFAIIVRDAVPFPLGVDIVVKCFQLNQLTDPQDCIALLQQLLDKKDFFKVCCCSCTHILSIVDTAVGLVLVMYR